MNLSLFKWLEDIRINSMIWYGWLSNQQRPFMLDSLAKRRSIQYLYINRTYCAFRDHPLKWMPVTFCFCSISIRFDGEKIYFHAAIHCTRFHIYVFKTHDSWSEWARAMIYIPKNNSLLATPHSKPHVFREYLKRHNYCLTAKTNMLTDRLDKSK